ncbi:MAG: carboxypeptidase-like regulatory domain-containing protein [Flavobacteriales bacterium]|nr:carboxypeptidase-like regulatory domain-containing protein [Flavobacteriales bacterium]
MLRSFFFLATLLCANSFAYAQTVLQGRVVDDRTLEPLAFVHIAVVGAQQGAQSDIDGLFSISVSRMPVTLRTSYVGYASSEPMFGSSDFQIIKLQQITAELAEVLILPTENQAHRIIQQVYKNRKINDGMRFRSYRYTSYSKTVFTGLRDSSEIAEPDTVKEPEPEASAVPDTLKIDMTKFYNEQHLAVIESATKKTFEPPAKEREEVLAMRVSGLKDPSLLALAASTKSFSVYDDQIAFNDKTYLGPIGPSSTNHYLFVIEDTLYQGVDSVYVISYRPRSGKKFEGLKGVLYVNTDGYALQNVIAEPVERSGAASIKLQQHHEKIDGLAWFPVQLNTSLYFDGLKLNGANVVGIGKTYLKDIEVDADVQRKELRGPEFEMDRLATRRDDSYWDALRNDSLDAKELRTYQVMDSMGDEVGLDRKLKWLSYALSGKIPIGPVDLRLNELMALNGYEGYRIGPSLATNDRLTRYASLGGYVAYGFKDKYWKYGGDLTIKPKPGRDLELKLTYKSDVAESGGVEFNGTPRSFTSESYRFFYMNRMDRIEQMRAELLVRVSSSLKFWFGTERSDRTNVIGYQFAQPIADDLTLLTDRFVTGAFTIGMRFAYREQLARMPDRQITLGSKWPVLFVNAFKSFDGLYDGTVETWRLNAMVEKKFRVRMLGALSVQVIGGVADDKAPYPFLFNMRGTWSGTVPIAAANAFQTMHPNEFLADRYGAVHLRHSFGKLLYKGKGKFQPEPTLVASAAWGELQHPEFHKGYAIKGLGEGFYEAGLQLDGILKFDVIRFGAGAYYRMGSNAFGYVKDDLAVKLTLGIGL